MPALVVNEKVVSSGRVLKASEIADLLKKRDFDMKNQKLRLSVFITLAAVK